jgi:hypothetical protein
MQREARGGNGNCVIEGVAGGGPPSGVAHEEGVLQSANSRFGHVDSILKGIARNEAGVRELGISLVPNCASQIRI